jgi:uncharacterized metal-binding protein (TIGR02443 family)
VKRFIAGAQCPQCQTLDSLYLNSEDAVEQLHCSRCDYLANRNDAQQAPESDKSEVKKEELVNWKK